MFFPHEKYIHSPSNRRTQSSINFKFKILFEYHLNQIKDSRVAQMVKSLPAMPETRVQSLSQEDPLEKDMATHAHIIA